MIMVLVYTHKITSRLRYTFKHFFESVLDIPVDFTTKLEVFIAQSGPKMSYTQTPLGNEFFVNSNSLLASVFASSELHQPRDFLCDP